MPILESDTRSVLDQSPLRGEIDAAAREAIEDDLRWQLAQRIAASRSLGRSRLLSEFLLYIVDRQLRGLVSDITEQQIGIHVFGRSAGYDSNEDNIVRSYARSLRKRITEYFVTEGKDETLLLEIPRGGYVPVFSPRPARASTQRVLAPALLQVESAPVPSLPDAPLESIPAEPPATQPVAWLRQYKLMLAVVVGVLLGFGIQAARAHHTARQTVEEATSSELWSTLFRSDHDTYVVPSDDGLIIMQRITERPVPLASYVSGDYRTNAKVEDDPSAAELLKLGARRYTSVVDLDFVSQIAQLQEARQVHMIVRYARDLRMDDLRNGNAILIGSTEANPWIQLFEPKMNFRFSIKTGPDKQSGILNAQPRPGEQSLYGTPQKDHTYGLIAFVPNLTSTGHVLIVGGLNTAGTQAAANFLMTPSLMRPVLERARTNRGEIGSFELLIGADNVAANASSPQLIIERKEP